MKEGKFLLPTYLFLTRNFPKFSMIQLNEVFNLATTCPDTKNSQKEKQHWKALSFLLSKRSGLSCHNKGLQTYGTKCKARLRMNSVLFLKVQKY